MSYVRSGSLEALRLRAAVLAKIRTLFAERGVLEVETPALSPTAVTDPALSSISAEIACLGSRHYLHTSPEHAMKRLLASGTGSIYQICRVYRDGELGRWHEPEFTLLEWYRVGWDETRLMDEVADIALAALGEAAHGWPILSLTYREAFMRALEFDPLAAGKDGLGSSGSSDSSNISDASGFTGVSSSTGSSRHLGGSSSPNASNSSNSSNFPRELEVRLTALGIDVPPQLSWNALLDLAFGTVVAPSLPAEALCFIRDFPAAQAALAKLKPGSPPVAARFELFAGGIELANGFRELTDANEQRRRFDADLRARRQSGRPEMPMDEAFLEALELGLPECAGVALGVDRLVALAAGATSLAEVLAFTHRSL